MWWQLRAWPTLPARLFSPLSLKASVRLGGLYISVYLCPTPRLTPLMPSLSVSKGTMDWLSLVVSCSLNISADSCVFNDIMIKIILCQKQLSHAYKRTHSHTCIAKDISGRTPTGHICKYLYIHTYVFMYACMPPQRVCCRCSTGFFNWGAN